MFHRLPQRSRSCISIYGRNIQIINNLLLKISNNFPFQYAQRHLTANVPSITEKPRAVFGLVHKMNKRMSYPILGLIALNFFVSSYIVYREFDSVITINTKLAKLEEMIDEAKDKEEKENDSF